MTLGAAIAARLAATAGFIALVPLARVFAGTLEQGTVMPCVSWTLVFSEPVSVHDAKTTEEDMFHHVQFTVFAATFEEVEAISNQLLSAIDHETVFSDRLASADGHRDIPSAIATTYARACDFVI